jgi:(p)ppGpp synthase/HD superfamily hydrolase
MKKYKTIMEEARNLQEGYDPSEPRASDGKWTKLGNSSDALAFATKAHSGQTRSDNTPYVEHPQRVAKTILDFKKSKNLDQLISAAYLHDTIEDTDTTFEDLKKMFGGLVAEIVMELTSDKEKIKELGKTEYLAQKMTGMSSYSLAIKLADRLDNVSDLKTAKTPEFRERYRKETETILDRIEKSRVLSGTHKKIIGLIRNKLSELDEKTT